MRHRRLIILKITRFFSEFNDAFLIYFMLLSSMRALSVTLSALFVSPVVIVALEKLEPSMIVDLKVTGVQFQARFLREAVLHYRTSFGALPTTLDQLVSSDVIVRLPKDSWGNRYIYRQTASQDGFVVYSPGIDTIDQNGGGDDVITGEKKYDCDIYGANCPLSPIEWAKLLSTLLFALSFAALVIIFVTRLYRSRFTRDAT